jgi:ABC-type multidrug transport system fused ATPase/permease subunit
MIANAIKRPMSYFDTTPLGQLMNRFSKDVDDVDITIPKDMIIAVQQILTAVGALCLSISVMPVLLVIFAILIPLLGWSFLKFLRASSELRRLLLLSYAPVLSNLGEIINGATTINAYGIDSEMKKAWEAAMDLSGSADMHEKHTSTWICIVNEYLISGVAIVVGFLVVLSKDVSFGTTDDPGSYGLALTWVLAVAGSVNLTVNFSGKVSKGMTSVQRIEEWVQAKEFERDFEAPKKPANWPSAGRMSGKDVYVKYRDGLPNV